MKKILFSLLVVVGCSKTENNLAEVMVKAQVPGATCVDYGTRDGVGIVRCTIPGEKESVQGIAVYSVAHPFQFFPLKGPEKATTTPPAPVPAPDAGVDGEGSGSKSK